MGAYYKGSLIYSIALVFALTLSRLWAQAPAPDFDAAHEKAVAQNPLGIVFALRAEGGRTQFRKGEIIRLELAYSSQVADTYQLEAREYDRVGRLNMTDRYVVDRPADAPDPLADYFHYGIVGLGGLSQMPPPLSAKPFVIKRDLNEWLRFDKPGHYRLYVSSARILTKKPGQSIGFGGKVVTSNILEFDILPDDAAWDDATLRDAVRVLDTPKTDSLVYNDSPRQRAARTLRFLGTLAAVREMVQRLGQADDATAFECRMGLWGAPGRAFVVQQLQARFDAPDFGVTQSLLNDAARMEYFAQHPEPEPPYPSGGTPAQIAEWQARRVQESRAEGTLEDEYLRRLNASVGNKHGQARAVTLDTLLLYPRKQSPARRQAVARAMAESFEALPPRDQSVLLEAAQWPLIRQPAMLGVLKHIYARLSVPPAPGRSDDWDRSYLRDLALRRLTEMQRAQGRALLLAQIRQAAPQAGFDVLQSLPDKTLPALDSTLARNLEQSQTTRQGDLLMQCRLIARYATGAILPRVLAVYYNGNGLDNRTMPPLLAYFLRVAPAQGAQMLAAEVRTERKGSGYFELFTEVAGYYTCPELEQLALATLNDPNAGLAADAADMLGRYGSASAEAALWRRLRRFHAQWQGREAQLTTQQYGLGTDARLGLALVKALTLSPAWLTTPAQVDEIRRLSLLPDVLMQAQVSTSMLPQNGTVLVYGDVVNEPGSGDTDDWRVAQYFLRSVDAVRRKMGQYPRGTQFAWMDGPIASATPPVRRAHDLLQAFALSHGMTLKP